MSFQLLSYIDRLYIKHCCSLRKILWDLIEGRVLSHTRKKRPVCRRFSTDALTERPEDAGCRNRHLLDLHQSPFSRVAALIPLGAVWRCVGGTQPCASCSPGCGYDHKCLEDQSYAISGWSSQLATIDTGRGQSGGRAVFCLSRLNNNAVGARCCWGESPYRSCKIRIRASQAVTIGATRDIHSYKRAHLSSQCPDDPPLWLRNVAI